MSSIKVPHPPDSGNDNTPTHPCPRCNRDHAIRNSGLFTHSYIWGRELQIEVWGIWGICLGASYLPYLEAKDVFND